MEDLRDRIFQTLSGDRVSASILADAAGIIAGTAEAADEAERLGLSLEWMLGEGSPVREGDEIARFCGDPRQVAMAEEVLIGLIAKPSGIATAARRAVALTGGRPRIVCGSWKKVPWTVKELYRRAVITGGAECRMSAAPFIYLDKNYTGLFGGIRESLEAVSGIADHLKVIQLKGRYKEILLEAFEAVQYGADILFLDTGDFGDVKIVVEGLKDSGLRDGVSIAFGGGVRISDIDVLSALDLDILCIGRDIIDAPLLDMRLELVVTAKKQLGGA